VQTELPPRPRWNHQCVKEETAREFVDQVREWADNLGIVPEDVDEKEFLAALALALIESPDAYHAGRYLEDFIGWPVNGDLICVLDRAFSRMKFVTSQFVHQWVTENNVRFPAQKGDLIRCKIGDLELTGRVTEVLRREARGLFVPNGKKTHMPIFAEEVLQILPERKQRPDNPPQPEPDTT
jgi:hypothetical protein